MFPALSGNQSPPINPGAQKIKTAIPQNALTVVITFAAFGTAPTTFTGLLVTIPALNAPGVTADLIAGLTTTTQATFQLSGPVFQSGYYLTVVVSP